MSLTIDFDKATVAEIFAYLDNLRQELRSIKTDIFLDDRPPRPAKPHELLVSRDGFYGQDAEVQEITLREVINISFAKLGLKPEGEISERALREMENVYIIKEYDQDNTGVALEHAVSHTNPQYEQMKKDYDFAMLGWEQKVRTWAIAKAMAMQAILEKHEAKQRALLDTLIARYGIPAPRKPSE